MEDLHLEAHAQKRKRFDIIDMSESPDGAKLSFEEPNKKIEIPRADSDHV